VSLNYIDEKVKAKLVAEYNDTSIAYDNIYFSSLGLESWIRYSLLPNTPYSIGNKCYRETGLLQFNVFVNTLSDTNEAYRLATVIADIFKLKRFDNIVTGLPDIVRIGANDKDQWFQINVYVNYHYDTQ